MFKRAILTLLCLTTTCCFAGTPSEQKLKEKKEAMLSDLEFIKNTFKSVYAPADWKKQQFGWDAEQQIAAIKEKILAKENFSTKEYRSELLNFVTSTKDYHVGTFFFSYEAALLPFTVKCAEGRYFVSSIDRTRLSSNVYKFSEGDELVSFDGRPVDDVVNELIDRYFNVSNPDTDRSMACMFLTIRAAVLGMDVPRGSIKVSFKSGSDDDDDDDDKVSTYQMTWQYMPEKVKADVIATLDEEIDESTLPLGQRSCFKTKMVSPIFDALQKNKMKFSSEDPHLMGSREGFIPDLGTKIWETDEDSPFYAYMSLTDNKKMIGFLRIPHYMFFFDDDMQELASIIDRFEEMTDALIIDQTNNSGGFAFFTYTLASMLATEPMHLPKHQLTITPEEVFQVADVIPALEEIYDDEDAVDVFGKDIIGYPVNFQVAQSILEFYRHIYDQWNLGNTLTDPFHFYIDQVNPHPDTQYTKPILILTNEMDISAADFFPSIMQDNKRATILGSRTAGAGGAVGFMHYPNRFGVIGIAYTKTIADRLNGNKIENLGVTPDIPYSLTADDMQNDYSGYVDCIMDAVLDLIDEAAEEAEGT